MSGSKNETPWFNVSEQSCWIKSMQDMIRRSVCVRSLGHSHQPLQGSLLVDLIGAVCDVRVKVRQRVLANDVADVIDHYVLLVSFLQFLEESEHRMNQGLVCQDSFRTWQQLESDASNHESRTHWGKYRIQ